MSEDGALQGWRAQGFKPGLVRNEEGRWALEFDPDAPLPYWADLSRGPVWYDTQEAAISAVLLDELVRSGLSTGR